MLIYLASFPRLPRLQFPIAFMYVSNLKLEPGNAWDVSASEQKLEPGNTWDHG